MAASPAPSPPAERRLKGITLRITAALCFAAMIATGKLASQWDVGVIELLFYRSLFALPVVLAWVMLGPGVQSLKTGKPLAHVSRSAIGLTGMACTFQAAIMLPLAEATTIGFAAPLFATIFSAFILSERVARYRWTAVILGFVGILIVTQPGTHAIAPGGVVIALMAAMFTAAVTITVRQIAATESPTAIVFWFMVAGIVVMGWLLPGTAVDHPPMVWLMLAMVGITGGLGQLFMTVSLRLAPVSALVPFDYMQLLGAVLFGWLFWSDVPAWTTVAGGALIAGSGIYTIYREHRLHREAPPAAAVS